jgi:hypothetical protein
MTHESSCTTNQIQFQNSLNSLWAAMYSVNNDPFFCQPGEATELQGSSQSYPIESDRQDVPIVSPVPLPYSAQSTAVLRRMISATQGTFSPSRCSSTKPDFIQTPVHPRVLCKAMTSESSGLTITQYLLTLRRLWYTPRMCKKVHFCLQVLSSLLTRPATFYA